MKRLQPKRGPGSPPSATGPLARLSGDPRGVAYAEYIIIVILIGIVVSIALIAVGVPLLRSFRLTQLFLGAPIP